jgi:probable DNA repair protein
MCAASRFEPEDLGQPVQVTGFVEAAQETFDHLWILGLDDETWPPGASSNPFLPLELQRAHGLPRITAERQLEWSRAITRKLLAAAPDIVASHARLSGERELSPSPLIAHLPLEKHAGVPQRWYLRPASMEVLEDTIAPPLVEGMMQSGGTRALKLQAACGFRAFAEIRLKARELDAPPLGFDHLMRGNLLHKALHYFWREMQSQPALSAASAPAVRECVAQAVNRAIAEEDGAPGTPFEVRLQAVERRRLIALLESWLEVERDRPLPFAVVEGERDREITIGGLTLRARIDRIDRLNDGRLVVIDYKSNAPSLSTWMGNRPEEPQVPLYATALEAPIAAVAFAQVQTGDSFFRSIGSEPPALNGLHSEDIGARIEEWREVLVRLAGDFRVGRAPVDPKDPSSCQYCGLHALCRIDEKQ